MAKEYKKEYMDAHDVLIGYIQSVDFRVWFSLHNAQCLDVDFVQAVYDFLDGLKKAELYNMGDATLKYAYFGFIVDNMVRYITNED